MGIGDWGLGIGGLGFWGTTPKPKTKKTKTPHTTQQNIFKIFFFIKTTIYKNTWGLGFWVGCFGFGGLAPHPNPQSPNPQSPIPNPHPHSIIYLFFILKTIIAL